MAESEPPSQEKPYVWDDSACPPPEVLQLWTEVGNGLEKSQTVVWKSAVESLDQANKHLRTSKDARAFVEKWMGPIIGILVEQQPAKIGHHERNCVTESLHSAVAIVAQDLEIQVERNGECKLLTSLNHIFNRKKAFYKGNKGTWNVNHLQGLPEVRVKMIDSFRQAGGFRILERYLVQKNGTPQFPPFEAFQYILQSLCDTAQTRPPTTEQVEAVKVVQDDAIAVANAVMQYIAGLSDDDLKKLPTDGLVVTQKELQRIFDRLVATRRDATYEFYRFWRALVLKLITSNSLPLKLFGWEQVGELIQACMDHRPPPRSFVVSGAGCTFANGVYSYGAEVTQDGYARPGCETTYVRTVPEAEEGGDKKLTLFRCTMRSQQKWWFLSEADEEQPGTDRDIDYYQHKSKEHEEAFPPPQGWITCRTAGIEPPPTLEPQGILVPEGEEFNTLEHQLAKWAIENEIVEQVLGDSTIHREVVARSTVLIKFLASMCNRDQPTEMMTDGQQPKKYCLQASHLLFAWKTCTRKADAAVSTQVYQLLVSILPLCPSDLAVPLLKAIQTSLLQQEDQRDYLFEVAEFCSALASSNLVDSKAGAGGLLSDDVREEVLNLLWSVLTHPNASSLKSYDVLKRYVTHELRVEPKGSEHREKFLKSCIETLSTFAGQRGGSIVNEIQALRTVKLTHFILEACPREQADRIVTDGSGALPVLLFNELTAYLERRKRGVGVSGFRKSSSMASSQPSTSDDAEQHGVALFDRLRISRYVYGVRVSDPRAGDTDRITISLPMIENLWQLCDAPEDREVLMMFIASAANPGKPQQVDHPQAAVSGPHVQAENSMSSAFTLEVCQSIFLKLYCSPSFDYRRLGDSAYKSFQFLFNGLRQAVTTSPEEKRIALDALWRLCLTVGSDVVATRAMRELLLVYVSNGDSNATEQMVMDEHDDRFGERIFQCLGRVKTDLDAKADGAERSAQRCLRILNAAIGQIDCEGYSMTPSTLTRLAALSPTASLHDATRCLPQGMRGQVCYRRITIQARRQTTSSNQAQPAMSHGYSDADRANGIVPVPPKNLKFSIDVHPLETLASLKYKVATNCQTTAAYVKPVQIHGRAIGAADRSGAGDHAQMNLNLVPEDTVIDELGILQGCEVIFLIGDRPWQSTVAVPSIKTPRTPHAHDMSGIFFEGDGSFSDKLFDKLIGILESLSWPDSDDMTDSDAVEAASVDSHKLIWDLLLAMPTYSVVTSQIQAALASRGGDTTSITSEDDAMEVESSGSLWSQLLDIRSFSRSVYVLLVIDACLQPAPESLSILPAEQRLNLEQTMVDEANSFRRAFIDSGGFNAVVNFFSASGNDASLKQGQTRRGNAVALRVLKSCLFGSVQDSYGSVEAASSTPDEAGSQLLQSLSDAEGLLKSLVAMVVDDSGISSSTVTDVLRFLRLLFQSDRAAQSFISLPDKLAQRFLFNVLVWDEATEGSPSASSQMASRNVRRSVHDLILVTPQLAESALPWLIKGIDDFDVDVETSYDYFDVLEKLVGDENATARSQKATDIELTDLGTAVCKKLAACPRPASEADLADSSTAVLNGCLKILRALIENGGGSVLRHGTEILLSELGITRWSGMARAPAKGLLAAVSSAFRSQSPAEDVVLVNLMGVIFDGFLSPIGSSTVAICGEKESRGLGFGVVAAAARFCEDGEGYMALVYRIGDLISSASPQLRHRWGQFGGSTESHSTRHGRVTSEYSGLRNQGCTCYMNSLLQQLFMMPELRKSMCAAPLPSSLRSSVGGVSSTGAELVGKKITLQWDSGVGYDALVESFDESTGMHTIRYQPIQVATVGGSGSVSGQHQQVEPDDISKLPESLPDEFILSEGRPGKETGVFELVTESSDMEGVSTTETKQPDLTKEVGIKETEDESASRRLLEEVQRTFIHLQEGSRGRCFDPRALVEACACLKLEFDVWQQNDASEFATKLLDRLEISLKRWAPSHFRYMDHTFGLKQTKQKICKECGLKTNREEKLLNIDCQIRGKSDIHEALAAMTEVEIMEGSNKVFCETCKKNTDTVLRTAISTLPNMLILSLKRFDLDFNTFETVKLNSRCAFGQTLNMKRYTLEGLEEMENSGQDQNENEETTSMDAEMPNTDEVSGLNVDEDYEYKLAGVLVHAGVAQGGHYYSFIKDRSRDGEDKWYRFDDEDVTPFDPAAIENECFGGKVKKETKWPNGQVHSVEQEQFANALMLFYEKVKTSEPPFREEDSEEETSKESPSKTVATMSGFDAFEPDVRRSNMMHRWQTFLFDPEFQTFMQGLLGICRLAISQSEQSNGDGDTAWRPAIMQMLLSFVFDVMLYSTDRSLEDWTCMLEETLLLDHTSALSFVRKLAQKSREVSRNWLRTYLLDCPDQEARNAAVRIFSAAVKSSTSSMEECQALDRWSQAWTEYLGALTNEGVLGTSPSALPCSLGRKWAMYENVEKLETGEASSLGAIISFLNVLLEHIPLCWRYSSETYLFVRFLASMPFADNANIFVRPMIAANIPARLIALAVRDRAPILLRNAFPGASVSAEVANTQIRAETHTTTHIMPMSGNQVMNTADASNSRGPSHEDVLRLFDALLCLARLPWSGDVELVRADSVVRGLERRVALTDRCAKALSIVFQEQCAPGAPGMGQDEIEQYLERTGPVMDHQDRVKEKINNMLTKYPTTTTTDGTSQGRYLSLEGFLAYYQDVSRTNDLKLRSDLHVMGFRPDLSRRSLDSRFVTIGDRQQPRLKMESVAIDVAEQFEDQAVDIGQLANYSLANCFHLYSLAYNLCEPLSEYLAAAATYRRDTKTLINRTLQTIYAAPNNEWQGHDTFIGAATMILQVVASSPGEDQELRIANIMLSEEQISRNPGYSVGLLQVARTFYEAPQGQRYGNDFHWNFEKYITLVSNLRTVYSVFKWMNEHRQEWSFMEREIQDSHTGIGHPNQMRGNYNVRGMENTLPLDHHTQSDSDMAGMNDSEDDDEDSQFDGVDFPPNINDGPAQIVVEGAGNQIVNGVYVQDGYFESSCRYAKECVWEGRPAKILILKCNVSNNTKHWYMSIVPAGASPGTSSDIDFYTAPEPKDGANRLTGWPPETGWVVAKEGLSPEPKLVFVPVPVDPAGDSPERTWNGGPNDEDGSQGALPSPYV